MFIAFIAALAAPAQAAVPPGVPATQSKQADPATLAEAIGLLDDGGFEDEALRSAEMSLEIMLAAMTEQIQKTTNEPVPDDLLEQLRQTMRDHSSSTLRANMGAIKRQAAAIYAQEFTRDELIRLRELSRDPVMVKSRERGKVINPKLMALGVRTMKAAQPELEAKIKRVISDYIAQEQKGADQS